MNALNLLAKGKDSDSIIYFKTIKTYRILVLEVPSLLGKTVSINS